MISMKVFVGAAALALSLALLSAGCWFGAGGGGGVNQNDAQAGEDVQGLEDADVTRDASAPGPGTIAIYLTGDLTPRTFTDGLTGQTPTSYFVAVSEYWVQTSLYDPSPVYCYDSGGSPVEADLYGDTLVGVCQTQDIPSAIYTHGRVKVEWTLYTVTGTLHYLGLPYPGDFTFFRAYSDTTYDGQSYLAGEGTIAFDGATQVQIPTTYDPPLSLPGVRLETIDGELWMTFPYSYPLAVDQTSTDRHWARAHWQLFEGFRWADTAATGNTDRHRGDGEHRHRLGRWRHRGRDRRGARRRHHRLSHHRLDG